MGSIGGDTTEQGLVLHLDAANEYSYAGSGTDWYDLSGYFNHGDFSGDPDTPTFSTDGLGCLDYNNLNERLDCGNDVSLQLTDYVTLEAWIRISATPDNTHYPAIITKRYSFGSNETSYVLILRNNVPLRPAQFLIHTNIGGYGIIGNTTLNDNIWHHIAGVYNGEDIRLYVNGESDITPVSASGTLLNQNYPVYVGAMLAGGVVNTAYNFQGKISIAKIYNRPLSATEVLQNYNAHKTRFGRK